MAMVCELGFILLSLLRIKINIVTENFKLSERMKKEPALNPASIRRLVDAVIKGVNIDITSCGGGLKLDLGEVSADDFGRQFPRRLKNALLTGWMKTAQASNHDIPRPGVRSSSPEYTSHERYPIWKTRRCNEEALLSAACEIVEDASHVRDPEEFLQRWRYLGQKQLTHSIALTQLGLKMGKTMGLPLRREDMAGMRLLAVAISYLLQHPKSVKWMVRHPPNRLLLDRLNRAVMSGEIPARWVLNWYQLLELLGPASETLLESWIVALGQQPGISSLLNRGADQRVFPRLNDVEAFQPQIRDENRSCVTRTLKRAIREPSDNITNMPECMIENAGLTLLWPLLPSLFEQEGLTQEFRFCDGLKQWQAILTLDWLIWGTEPRSNRLTLGRLLCGLPGGSQPPSLAPIGLREQGNVENWLLTTCSSLHFWEDFSISTIRQLWLQRPGLIRGENPFQVVVASEAQDKLLRGLPWPVTFISLPWMTTCGLLDWRFSES